MKRLLLVLGTGIVGAALLLPQTAGALTVAPARLEIEGAPGAHVDAEFTVINEEAQSRTFYVSAENFEAQGETGAPSFRQSGEGLASWITAEQQITLAPREARTVPFRVQIPAGTEPGGHFAAVFLSNTPPATGGATSTQVSVGAKIGVLVLLRVLGDIEEGGDLLEFAPENGASFHTTLPVNFYYRFRNSGADRVRPEGFVTIKNTIGLTTDRIAANPSEGNVLPGSIRRFPVTWGPEEATTTRSFFGTAAYQLRHFAFGRYSANLAIAYGTNGQQAEGTTAVYVVPWQLLTIVVVIILLVFFVGRMVVRRYNRWVISRARAS